MKKHLTDTILYSPSVIVTNVDKINNIVHVSDLIKGIDLQTKLIQSKTCDGQYFRLGRRTYWLHLLFEIN